MPTFLLNFSFLSLCENDYSQCGIEKFKKKSFIFNFKNINSSLWLFFKIFFFQFRVQSTLMGVAQAVVDKIVRLHHDAYMNGSGSIVGGKRDDITLLVRNFNFPMPHGTGAPAGLISNNVNSVRFNPVVRTVKPPLYPSENSNYVIIVVK